MSNTNANTNTFDLTIRDYNALTFKDLRIACRDYQPKKLGSDGNKKDLILRLCAADAARGNARLQELLDQRAAKTVAQAATGAEAEEEGHGPLFVEKNAELAEEIQKLRDFLEGVEEVKSACNANPVGFFDLDF
ncbi:hypothetical protein BDZ45DRAFT_688496 [Acephala macrosclerotiorum]|nr:hypothetical protein BDZ45DRAFT_688496 [Acephala macrosclerotiorum]